MPGPSSAMPGIFLCAAAASQASSPHSGFSELVPGCSPFLGVFNIVSLADADGVVPTPLSDSHGNADAAWMPLPGKASPFADDTAVVVLPFCAAVVAVVPPFSEVGFGLPEPISLEESDGAGACTVRPAPFVDLVNAGLHPVANALIMASCPARGSKVNLLIRHELVQKKQELQMEGAELSPVILVHVQASTHLPWVAPNALGDRFGKELAVCNTLEAG